MTNNNLTLPPHLATKLRDTPYNFVITGASGWLGQATLELLDTTLTDTTPRRVTLFGSHARPLTLRSGRTLPCQTLAEIANLPPGPKFFLHYAFLTKDRLTNEPIETFITANEKIRTQLADAIKQNDTRALFTPSSGAVYKKGTHTLDADPQTNPYGAMKIADEKLFTTLAEQKNFPLCMPRLFNLSGPFINKHDTYALASMIKCVLANEPITIRAAHRVVRSYIHIADLLTLAFAMLLEPQPQDHPIFDTAGDKPLEMRDLADDIRKALGRPTHPITRPPHTDAPDDIYVGKAKLMKNMMQARGLPLHPIEPQIQDTADYMRSQ